MSINSLSVDVESSDFDCRHNSRTNLHRKLHQQKQPSHQTFYRLIHTVIFLFAVIAFLLLSLNWLVRFSANFSSKLSSSTLLENNKFSTNDLTSLKDSIRLIREQKAKLLHLLNSSTEVSYQNSIPLDLLLARKPSITEGSVKVDGRIFWSPAVESLLHSKDQNSGDSEWLESSLANATVVRIEPGCGRSQNRLATLADGRKLCFRYRTNVDQIQGEYVSYLLARLLGLADNVAPTALLTFDPSSSSSTLNWSPAVASELVTGSARWQPKKTIVATAFIDNLLPAYIPLPFQHRSSDQKPRLHPVEEDLKNIVASGQTSDLAQLVQWSDLLVFDYLTANVDRLVNNLVNQQWNEEAMISAPVHNLLLQQNNENKSTSTNRLLFLDNESGLFHGYRLLGRFDHLHKKLLESLCIFRQSTVYRLESLYSLGERKLAEKLLKTAYNRKGSDLPEDTSESLFTSKQPLLPKANLRTLRRRMGTLLQQVANCRRQFK